MITVNYRSTVVRVEHLLSTELDDETILMSIERGQFYGIGRTARRIWQLIAKPQKVADLIDLLAEEYQISSSICGPDVLEYLQELHREKLIAVE